MTTTIDTVEPFGFVSGNQVQWKKSLPDYPAGSGWELSYAVRGPEQIDLAFDTEVVASGDDYLVTWATGTIAAGTYWWQATVTKAGVSITVASGEFEVKANLATAAGVYDGRSHVKIVLDALEAVLQGKATQDQKSYKIGDREIEKLTPDELLTFYKQYKRWYADEKTKTRLNKGLPSNRQIKVRF